MTFSPTAITIVYTGKAGTNWDANCIIGHHTVLVPQATTESMRCSLWEDNNRLKAFFTPKKKKKTKYRGEEKVKVIVWTESERPTILQRL